MHRKEFLGSLGKTALGTGLLSVLAKPCAVLAREQDAKVPGHSCTERVEFAEGWIKRFFEVLDDSLDSKTKEEIMKANGRSCWRAYISSIGKEIKPISFDDWAAKVSEQAKDDAIRIEGNVVYMQYNKNYQGLDAPEGFCLCPLVESKPQGLSPTYCQCSVGYVKEMFEMTLGQPVEVELLESVLNGGKRCRFKIQVS